MSSSHPMVPHPAGNNLVQPTPVFSNRLAYKAIPMSYYARIPPSAKYLLIAYLAMRAIEPRVTVVPELVTLRVLSSIGTHTRIHAGIAVIARVVQTNKTRYTTVFYRTQHDMSEATVTWSC